MCSKLDPDSIFAYSVPRTVRIRDRRLGIIHIICVLAIMGYILGYTVIYEQRYLLMANDIFGSARLQLVGPSSQFTVLPSNTTYCTGGTVPWNGYPPVVQNPCRYLDTYASVFPEEEASAMLIATRITDSNYSRFPGCEQQPLPSCGYNQTSSTTYYVGGPVEMSTLQVREVASL
jgi:hypothetical protein